MHLGSFRCNYFYVANYVIRYGLIKLIWSFIMSSGVKEKEPERGSDIACPLTLRANTSFGVKTVKGTCARAIAAKSE
jgi:hypothetical protein